RGGRRAAQLHLRDPGGFRRMRSHRRRAPGIVLALAIPAATIARAADPPAPAGAAEPQAAPARAWSTMFHGYAFLTSNRQGGDSGEQDFESENHFMAVATRARGPATWELLGTFTLEPMTVTPAGAPDLFQRGETYRGSLLIDRQHP